jgi:hypothetical protein
MNCKIPAILLLAFLPSLCLAQKDARLARGGDTRVAQLFDEIAVLQRLATLALTSAQVDQLLPLYAKSQPPDDSGQAAVIAKLEPIKQRLLGGTPLVATDLATLKELQRQAAENRRNAAPKTAKTAAAAPAMGTQPLTPLEQSLWDLLTPTQQATLLGDPRGPVANNQKLNAALGQRALKLIGELLKLDDAAWPAARDALALALATDAGPADSPARANSQKLFVDFLDRLRKMPATDFTQRQAELGAELQALLPPNTNLLLAIARYDTKLIHAAMATSLTHPRAPDLLQQMKDARAKTQAP